MYGIYFSLWILKNICMAQVTFTLNYIYISVFQNMCSYSMQFYIFKYYYNIRYHELIKSYILLNQFESVYIDYRLFPLPYSINNS